MPQPFPIFPHEITALLSRSQTQFWRPAGTIPGCETAGEELLAGVHALWGVPGEWVWVQEPCHIWTMGAEEPDVIYLDDPDLDARLAALPHQVSLSVAAATMHVGTWQGIAAAAMPQWAARMAFQIANMRVIRVQDVTESAAQEAGIGFSRLRRQAGIAHWWAAGQWHILARDAFAAQWDALYASQGASFELNPWAVVVERGVMWVHNIR